MERFPVTVLRAAALLNVCPSSIRNWINQFDIPTTTGPRGVLIKVEVLDTQLARCRRTGEAPEIIKAIRKAHNAVTEYQLAGGERNLEPQRVQLDGFWYTALSGAAICHEALGGVLDYCAAHVTALRDLDVDLERSA